MVEKISMTGAGTSRQAWHMRLRCWSLATAVGLILATVMPTNGAASNMRRRAAVVSKRFSRRQLEGESDLESQEPSDCYDNIPDLQDKIWDDFFTLYESKEKGEEIEPLTLDDEGNQKSEFERRTYTLCPGSYNLKDPDYTQWFASALVLTLPRTTLQCLHEGECEIHSCYYDEESRIFAPQVYVVSGRDANRYFDLGLSLLEGDEEETPDIFSQATGIRVSGITFTSCGGINVVAAGKGLASTVTFADCHWKNNTGTANVWVEAGESLVETTPAPTSTSTAAPVQPTPTTTVAPFTDTKTPTNTTTLLSNNTKTLEQANATESTFNATNVSQVDINAQQNTQTASGKVLRTFNETRTYQLSESTVEPEETGQQREQTTLEPEEVGKQKQQETTIPPTETNDQQANHNASDEEQNETNAGTENETLGQQSTKQNPEGDDQSAAESLIQDKVTQVQDEAVEETHRGSGEEPSEVSPEQTAQDSEEAPVEVETLQDSGAEPIGETHQDSASEPLGAPLEETPENSVEDEVFGEDQVAGVDPLVDISKSQPDGIVTTEAISTTTSSLEISDAFDESDKSKLSQPDARETTTPSPTTSNWPIFLGTSSTTSTDAPVTVESSPENVAMNSNEHVFGVRRDLQIAKGPGTREFTYVYTDPPFEGDDSDEETLVAPTPREEGMAMAHEGQNSDHVQHTNFVYESDEDANEEDLGDVEDAAGAAEEVADVDADADVSVHEAEKNADSDSSPSKSPQDNSAGHGQNEPTTPLTSPPENDEHTAEVMGNGSPGEELQGPSKADPEDPESVVADSAEAESTGSVQKEQEEVESTQDTSQQDNTGKNGTVHDESSTSDNKTQDPSNSTTLPGSTSSPETTEMVEQEENETSTETPQVNVDEGPVPTSEEAEENTSLYEGPDGQKVKNANLVDSETPENEGGKEGKKELPNLANNEQQQQLRIFEGSGSESGTHSEGEAAHSRTQMQDGSAQGNYDQGMAAQFERCTFENNNVQEAVVVGINSLISFTESVFDSNRAETIVSNRGGGTLSLGNSCLVDNSFRSLAPVVSDAKSEVTSEAPFFRENKRVSGDSACTEGFLQLSEEFKGASMCVVSSSSNLFCNPPPTSSEPTEIPTTVPTTSTSTSTSTSTPAPLETSTAEANTSANKENDTTAESQNSAHSEGMDHQETSQKQSNVFNQVRPSNVLASAESTRDASSAFSMKTSTSLRWMSACTTLFLWHAISR